MKLLSTIFGWFNRTEDIEDIDLEGIVLPEDISNSIEDFNYDMIADPVIYGNKDSKKAFLIMDDLEDVFFLYETDFKNIKKTLGYDILNEFKIVKCSGDDAGFIADKYLVDSKDDIVIALLDITLGKIIKLHSGEVLTFDGVDIALTIMDKYPKCQIKFCSAHRLNKKNPEIHSFISKFEDNTGCMIEDYYFSKNSNRVDYIYKLTQSVLK